MRRNSNNRVRHSAALAAPLMIAWALAFGSLASAAPIFFTGPTNSDGFVLGVSEADAHDSGLDIIHFPGFQMVDFDDLTVSNGTIAGTVIDGVDSDRATQGYTVTNDSGPENPGTLYLVFESMSTAVVGGDTWDYDPTTIGVNLTDEWVIFSEYDADLGQDVFFPAISLDALVLLETTTVPVEFVLTEPIWTYTFENNQVTAVLMLPQMLVDAAFVPVPEPSSCALMGLGLCVLAWRFRSRRS